jgi:NADPH:quinone reductase-like Zn-dependent oxidoreductase
MWNDGKKWTILGQDPAILQALWANVVSWLVSTLYPSFLPRLLPLCEYEADNKTFDNSIASNSAVTTRCISIGRPGGLEQLRLIDLKPNVITKGYNVVNGSPFLPMASVPDDCVVLDNYAFSVNYADCCIRWGLYESAKQFVGWPIVPGFDVAGIVRTAAASSHNNSNLADDLKPGDRVFGCTLFGAYSTRIAIPAAQLRKIPDNMSLVQAASLPAVSLTALYALHLAGHYPVSPVKRCNTAILIHSAAGGVGSMAIQMAKQLGLHPIVGVVGSSHKVKTALALGCDHVIDKSTIKDLWAEAQRLSPSQSYSAILDPNGVSTLQESYNHLSSTGRLVVFGFHSNLPLGRDMLSPYQWIQMGRKMGSMPKFDPMDLVVSNKAVLGFNLSFFADETELVGSLFDQVCEWWEGGALMCPQVVQMDMGRIAEAHQLIMSGQSIGKIVLTTQDEEADEM